MVPCSDINDNFKTPPDTMRACAGEREQPWTAGVAQYLGGTEKQLLCYF